MLPKLSEERRAALQRGLTGDPATVVDILVRFLREETRKAGFERLVIGLSGGIDSCLAATLAVHALGEDAVLGVLMPCGRTRQAQAVEDAEQVAQSLHIRTELVDIEPLVTTGFAADPEASPLRRGNFMARQRMVILFDRSMRDRALVVGTSNKTELLLGYGTLFGDLASALNPLGDLYKTQVRAVARFLALPESILLKPPSAELWPGQTDEGELGMSYEDVDQALYLLVDRRLTQAEVVDYGLDPQFVEEVSRRIQNTQYKRRLPLIAKVSARTIGLDFRYARDWGK